jgi:hypothetical protein
VKSKFMSLSIALLIVFSSSALFPAPIVQAQTSTPTVTPHYGAFVNGQSISVTPWWAGGTGPFHATYDVNSAPSCPQVFAGPGFDHIDLGPASGVASATLIAGPTTNLYVCVGITDTSDGITMWSGVTSYVNVGGVDPPAVSALAPPTISVTPDKIGGGQSADLSTAVSFVNGTSPYTCQWFVESPAATSFNNLGSSFTTGCDPSSKPSVSTGTLTKAGTWRFELQVTDATGAVVASSATTLTVSNLPGITLKLSCNPHVVVF